MGSEFERYATIGEIVSVDGKSGIVQASFSTTEEDVLLRIYDMSLARQGIDIEVGHMFRATLNSEIYTPEDAHPRGFRALAQLVPGDTLDSLSSHD